MYSSSGELHLELLTGQSEGAKALWVSTLMHRLSLITPSCMHYSFIVLFHCMLVLIPPPSPLLCVRSLLVTVSFLTRGISLGAVSVRVLVKHFYPMFYYLYNV